MSDFSSVVDDVAAEVGKPGDAAAVARYVNEAIRYVEGQLDDDLMAEEYQLFADNHGNVAWEIPDIKRHRRVLFAKDGAGQIIAKTRPSEQMQRMIEEGCPYYYQTGKCLTFSCISSCVFMSVLNHSPWFKYYDRAARPAIWLDNFWYGLEAGVHGPPAQESQRAMVTSLTLEAHAELVKQRAVTAYLMATNDPARNDANAEYQRLWNITTANSCG